jgi:hypothetical protein
MYPTWDHRTRDDGDPEGDDPSMTVRVQIVERTDHLDLFGAHHAGDPAVLTCIQR